MAWFEKIDGDGYMDLAAADEMRVVGAGSEWYLDVYSRGILLGRPKGIYTTKTIAHQAAQKLCQGVNPTLITEGT